MTLDEKAALFERIGVVHVFENELSDFIKAIEAKRLSYSAPWDNGLKCYVFMLEENKGEL